MPGLILPRLTACQVRQDPRHTTRKCVSEYLGENQPHSVQVGSKCNIPRGYTAGVASRPAQKQHRVPTETLKSVCQKENRSPKLPPQAQEVPEESDHHTHRSSSLTSSSLQDTWKLLDLGSSLSGVTSQDDSAAGRRAACLTTTNRVGYQRGYKQQLSLAVEREQSLERDHVQLGLDWQRRCDDVERDHIQRSEALIRGLTRARDQEGVWSLCPKDQHCPQMDIFPGVCQARGDREGTAQAGDVAEGCVTRERPGYGNSAEARAPPWTGGTGRRPRDRRRAGYGGVGGSARGRPGNAGPGVPEAPSRGLALPAAPARRAWRRFALARATESAPRLGSRVYWKSKKCPHRKTSKQRTKPVLAAGAAQTPRRARSVHAGSSEELRQAREVGVDEVGGQVAVVVGGVSVCPQGDEVPAEASEAAVAGNQPCKVTKSQ
ncbi:hypothetical protein NN561_015100 [Cricetulus griseus]